MVKVRPLILLALLLLFQMGPQLAPAWSMEGDAGCGVGAAMSCCGPGHCPCASETTDQAPSMPVTVPDGSGREWVARPICITLVENAIRIRALRPSACRGTVPEVALSAVPVPRTVLLCTFLI